MESFEEKSDESPSVVGSAAADELARLDTLEDSAWMNQNCANAPRSVRAMMLLSSIGVLTAMGLVIRDYGDSNIGLAALPAIAAIFIAGVILVERKYSGAKPKSVFPPLRLFKRQLPQIVALQIPMIFFGRAFFNAVENGASSTWFVQVVAAFFAVTALWAYVLHRFGIWDRLDFSETATS